MEHENEEKETQLRLFPEREYPEMGIEGYWLLDPYAWTSPYAEVLRFYAEYLRQSGRSLPGSLADALEKGTRSV